MWIGTFIGLPTFRGLFATIGLLIAPCLACRGEIPVLTVCEAISQRLAYNGESVIVVGKYSVYMEGVSLHALCDMKAATDGRNWPDSIWLGYDRDLVAAPPANVPEYPDYEPQILRKLPDSEATHWKVVADCANLPGLWAAVYGRFETKNPFPLSRGIPVGFGHLGMYLAQLVYPSRGSWCLVPEEKYPEFVALGKKRQEEYKLALWRNIKYALQDSDGREYFGAHMKDHLLPPLKGTVISVDSLESPSVIVVAISDPTTPDVRLRLHPRLNRSIAPGSGVEFEGVPTAFALEPFMVTLDVAAAKLTVHSDAEALTKVAVPE